MYILYYMYMYTVYIHVLYMYSTCNFRSCLYLFYCNCYSIYSYEIISFSRDDDDDDERPVTGLVSTGELLGEKPENMINLPIIKKEEHQVWVW